MSIASGYKKFKKYILTSSGFQLVSHWTKANTLEFDDGKTAQDKLGAIDGISSSRESNSDKIAASTALVSELNSDLGGYKFSKTTDGKPGFIVPGGADTVIPFKKDPIIKSGSNTDSGWGNFVINTGLERIDLFMARYDGSYYNGMLLYVRSTSSGWSIIMNHNLNKSALNSLFTINGGAVTIQNKSGLWSDAGTWVWYAYQFPD